MNFALLIISVMQVFLLLEAHAGFSEERYQSCMAELNNKISLMAAHCAKLKSSSQSSEPDEFTASTENCSTTSYQAATKSCRKQAQIIDAATPATDQQDNCEVMESDSIPLENSNLNLGVKPPANTAKARFKCRQR